MAEYIERQAVIDALKTQADTMRTWVERYAEQRVGILTAVNIVEDIEPADAAPVVHGKWVDHDGNKVQLNEHGETCGTCFCSRCGEWLVASDEYAVKGYFCPNCGAKMDGGESDG